PLHDALRICLRDRFEFDTAAVHRLRDQGVPAIEAVSRVLDQMGVSAGSVERMGRTVEGRTATIRDFFDQFRGAVGGGLFQRFETALGVVVTLIDRYGDSVLRAADLTSRWLGRFADEVTRNFTGPAMALLRVFAPDVWQTINVELHRAAHHTANIAPPTQAAAPAGASLARQLGEVGVAAAEVQQQAN